MNNEVMAGLSERGFLAYQRKVWNTFDPPRAPNAFELATGAVGLSHCPRSLQRPLVDILAHPSSLTNAASGGELDPKRLKEGQAILDRGCVSHNYTYFYRDAIEVSLKAGDWECAEGYITALHIYFRDEPTPWSDFIIARGRVLAELGRGSFREPMLIEMQRLRDQAAHLGMRAELSGLEAAFESTRPA